jgi:SAM-dependent methyltransferase
METPEEQAARYAAISELYDPTTIAHLSRRGVAPGWRCLEVGAGGGSIARWMADRVGPTGYVLATDIDRPFVDVGSQMNPAGLRISAGGFDEAVTGRIDGGPAASRLPPNLEVRRHDITSDPLPAAAFDLIHTRLVLIHLPSRDEVLRRLLGALRPGGWLLIEEFDSVSVSPDPESFADESLLATHGAMTRVLRERGVDRAYGRRLVGRLRGLGLVDVGAEARMFMLQGGSPPARLLRATFCRLREAMIDAGYVTAQEFARDLARLADPDFLMPSPALWSAWGSRP